MPDTRSTLAIAETDHPLQEIETVARRLAQENQNAEPGITLTYLFPDADEIRLVHLDSASPAAEGETTIMPFYFGPDRSGDIPYRSAIALIRPEEQEWLTLPDGWGDWNQAVQIPRESN